MDFTVIDFETPNNTHASICQMGIAVVENFEIKQHKSYLIKPEPFYFDSYNSKIHGIRAKDVRNMPTLDKLWHEIRPYLETKLIIAHNVLFDVSVLKKNLLFYNIDCPLFTYFCSCDLSKAAWKDFENYRLDTVAKNLLFSFKHHDAGEDAYTTAQIVLKAMEEYDIKSINDITRVFEIPIYKSTDTNHSFEKIPTTKIYANSITANNQEFDENHPFYGKEIVVTGRFATLTRKTLYQKLVDAGAVIEDKVTDNTDILVIGAIDRNVMTIKRKTAESIEKKGGNIQIWTERDFLPRLGNVRVNR